ncbi:DUF397 domain-containing protein [Catenuloplanes sp. NPDC051500]|uniref:DUF397 domain-containing protein n=1 Tax=Catenuloplanes sp. NPDC051500 TaxID=3363959 RepID=UPI0037B4CB9C
MPVGVMAQQQGFRYMKDNRAMWFRASGCRDGYCVEVATSPAGMLVRDAKDEERGAVLSFATESWQAFIGSLRKEAGGAGRV